MKQMFFNDTLNRADEGKSGNLVKLLGLGK